MNISSKLVWMPHRSVTLGYLNLRVGAVQGNLCCPHSHNKRFFFVFSFHLFQTVSECEDVSIMNKIQNQIGLISLSNGFIHLAAGFGDTLSRTVHLTL